MRSSKTSPASRDGSVRWCTCSLLSRCFWSGTQLGEYSRLFQRLSKTSARWQLERTRRVTSLVMATRAPSSTVSSKTLCRFFSYSSHAYSLVIRVSSLQDSGWRLQYVEVLFDRTLVSDYVLIPTARGDGTGGKVCTLGISCIVFSFLSLSLSTVTSSRMRTCELEGFLDTCLIQTLHQQTQAHRSWHAFHG